MSSWSGTLRWRLQKLGLAAYRRSLVFYCLQPPETMTAPALPEGFEFRALQAADLEQLLYPGGWLSLDEARQWLERGDSDLCAIIRGGRICAYLWLERRIARIDYLDLDAPLPESHGYISKVLVTREWRRHGLARVMYEAVAACGSWRVLHSACVPWNEPMHRLFAQLGWRRRLLITSWKLPGLQWFDIRPLQNGDTARFLSPERAAEALFAVREDRP
ncbi:MAG: hypothetical protein KatS3mg005_0065 [Bryobacteraceae bacterium]|nr:MAG: hypothetical protein KatS3mg005_0065 [Bryobacteraceae bacterium]